MTRTDLAYRKTATEGASGFGILTAMYDTLAGDLRRAAEAERAGDLEKRSREVKHAMLVVAYLEDWISRGSDGDLARQLVGFYASLRRKVLEAQVKRSAKMLEEQMARVLKVREQWQLVDRRTEPTDPEFLTPEIRVPEIMAPVIPQRYPMAFAPQAERRSGSWSA